MKRYNDIEQYAQIYKDTFVNESVDLRLDDIRELPQTDKDQALVDIVNAVYEYFEHKSDAEETITSIAGIIEDNKIDEMRY